MKWPSIALAAEFLLLCGCGSDLAPPNVMTAGGEVVPFEQVASATLSPVDSASYRVILDEESWAAAWSQLVAGHVPPNPALPSIDFKSRIVVLVAAGELPTQLRSFGVDEIRLSDGVFHVTVREDWPAAQCGSLPVVTHPVNVVSVPRLSTRADFAQRRTSSC